jgi:tetratricopeptide (TPR) repeat protein
MDALLEALAHDPAQTRRRWLGVAATVALFAAGVPLFWQARREQQLKCSGAAQQLAAAWNDERREAVHRAFRATGMPFAEHAFRGASAALDAYSKSWVTMRTDACEATRVRGEQSEELLDLRMDCLGQRREELRALIDVFTQADASVVAKAVQAASGLSDLGSCANAAALRATVRPPSDPRARGQVEAQRTQLSRAKALEEAGRCADGLAIATSVASAATKLGYQPLEAEALYQLGALQDRDGKEQEAEETLMKAAAVAQAARYDQIAARIWVKLLWVGVLEAHYTDALRWGALADATVERAGSDDLVRATLFANWGNLHWDQGQYDQALADHRRALALREKVQGHEHPSVASSLLDIGNVLDDQGKSDEALASYRRALAIEERTLGPDHPNTGITLNNISETLGHRGRVEEALSYARRALAVEEKAFGPDHPDTSQPLGNVGVLLAQRGQLDEALALLRRSLAIREKTYGSDHPEVAEDLFDVGDTLARQGHLAQALTTYRRAMPIYEKAYGATNSRVAIRLVSFAGLLTTAGAYREALEDDRRALGILEHALGAAHPSVALALTGLGNALIGLRQADQAVAPLERALRIHQATPRNPADEAETRLALARALKLSRD